MRCPVFLAGTGRDRCRPYCTLGSGGFRGSKRGGPDDLFLNIVSIIFPMNRVSVGLRNPIERGGDIDPPLRCHAAKKVDEAFLVSGSLRHVVYVTFIAIRVDWIRVFGPVLFPRRMRGFIKARWLGNSDG